MREYLPNDEVKDCTLRKDWRCTSDCDKCSFYKPNAEKAAWALKHYGLTRCSDGLYRLMIPGVDK